MQEKRALVRIKKTTDKKRAVRIKHGDMEQMQQMTRQMEETRIYLYDADAGTSHALLLGCARDFAARIGLTAPHLFLDTLPQGKPYFPEAPQLCFSVSHSARYWMCAFSQTPVGADIQVRRAAAVARVIRRWYSAREIDLVRRSGTEMFFDLWCAKEAYLKYRGCGLGWLRNNVDAADERGVRTVIDGVRCCRIQLPFDGYAACVCGGAGPLVLADYTRG